jgi:hypothetical protein
MATAQAFGEGFPSGGAFVVSVVLETLSVSAMAETSELGAKV